MPNAEIDDRNALEASMKAFSRYRGGQLAVILTLALPTLVGAIALGANVSIFYFNRVQLQKGADAAVLAGASCLPSNPLMALNTARSYANLNGVKAAEIVSTRVSSSNTVITMKVRRAVSYYFAPIFGLTGVVSAAATAGVEVSRPSGRPISVAIHYGAPAPAYRRAVAEAHVAGRYYLNSFNKETMG